MHFLQPFLPEPATIAAVAPIAFVFALAAAALVGWLRTRREVRAPYTRKAFHFIILSAALLVQTRWGLHGTVVYGSVVALIVLAAVARSERSAFYQAIARPTDAPHQSLFILVPLATTAVGGVLANVLFPTWAAVGYMVVAWGDAIAEPVGTRWGRHRYAVPSLRGVPATRSLEGSAAVFVAGSLAAAAALVTLGLPAATALGASAVIGLVSAIVEAISNHGLDNLTLQIAAAATAALLLG